MVPKSVSLKKIVFHKERNYIQSLRVNTKTNKLFCFRMDFHRNALYDLAVVSRDE